MIPNHWYAILASKLLKKKPLAIKRFNLDLVLWRRKDQQVIAMPDRCPHRGVSLSLGSVHNDRIVCKYHGFEFESNGYCASIPCDLRSHTISKALSINTFSIREENDLIWLWWGMPGQESPQIPWIEGVPRQASLANMSIEWPQHYVRSIETNFDGSHFFFVHRAFLPGIGSHISQIKTEDRNNGFSCTMEVENLKSKKTMQFKTEFLAPNISTIGFGNLYGGLIIDTPIDDQFTWRYMRVSKFPFDIPIISSVLGRVAIFLDWLLTQKMQDQPIITTMKPRLPIENAHHFVRADLGIAKYRIMRRHLIGQALSNKASFPSHIQDEMNKAVDVYGIKPILSSNNTINNNNFDILSANQIWD